MLLFALFDGFCLIPPSLAFKKLPLTSHRQQSSIHNELSFHPLPPSLRLSCQSVLHCCTGDAHLQWLKTPLCREAPLQTDTAA